MLVVMGMVTLLGLMVVASVRQSVMQSRNLSASLSDVEKFYAEEMAAISTYAWSTSGGGFADTRTQINTFSNSYQNLVGTGQGGADRGVATLRTTAPADSATSAVRRLGNLFHVVKNSATARQFCGDATLAEGTKQANFTDMCLTQQMCSASVPASCYSTEPIDQLYRSILGRYPNAGEATSQVASVASGITNINAIQGALRSSAEYSNRAPINCTNTSGTQTHTYTASQRRQAADYVEGVTAVFRALLGRFPTSAERQLYGRQLMGCPGVIPVVAPRSLDQVIAAVRALPEFTNAAGNNRRVHAEPIREIYKMLLGRDPAINDNGNLATIAEMRDWLGKLTGQLPTYNDAVSTAPPFLYGTPLSPFGTTGGPFGGASNTAMFASEIESSPTPYRTAAGGPIGGGISETTEYSDIDGGSGGFVIGLFRTVLGRVPAGPAPRDEIAYYTTLMDEPYNVPPSYIASSLQASDEFASRGGGCGCAQVPAPVCQMTASKVAAQPGDSITFTLHALENNEVNPSGFVNVGRPSATWNGTSPPGTITSVYWRSNRTLTAGINTYTHTVTAGAIGTTLTESAVVAGPGGSTTCSFSVPVMNLGGACTIHMTKRGPGPGSIWQFGGAGDVATAQGPYSSGGGGGGSAPHRFYYGWKVWIPGRPASEFDWATTFRYGAGWNSNVTAPATLSGSYDPCNRLHTNPLCIMDPTTLTPTPMPRSAVVGGVTYRLLTRISDGTNQTYANGGVCGSQDCLCYVAGVTSPLLIDFSGKGIRLRSGVRFNMGAGALDKFWPIDGEKVGFVTLDRNGDGNIGDIHELFGSDTKGPDGKKAGNGFDALIKYNKNSDYVINHLDPIYQDLRIWFDRNRNGKSERSELVPLLDAGVEEISLYYSNVNQPLDPFGNTVRQRSVVRLTSGETRPIVDAWLADGNPNDLGLAKVKVSKAETVGVAE